LQAAYICCHPSGLSKTGAQTAGASLSIQLSTSLLLLSIIKSDVWRVLTGSLILRRRNTHTYIVICGNKFCLLFIPGAEPTLHGAESFFRS
jgi:hypothetical protein